MGAGDSRSTFDGRTYSVELNVYDLHSSNRVTSALGFGAYHSGVVYRGKEYTFSGQSGVFYHSPKQVSPPAVFKETILLGESSKTNREFTQILRELRKQYPPSSYSLVTNNCNHFSKSLCEELLDNPKFPSWINRLANTGSIFVKEKKKNSQKLKLTNPSSPPLNTNRKKISAKQQQLLDKMRSKKRKKK